MREGSGERRRKGRKKKEKEEEQGAGKGEEGVWGRKMQTEGEGRRRK